MFFCRRTDPAFLVVLPVDQKINLVSPKEKKFESSYITFTFYITFLNGLLTGLLWSTILFLKFSYL